MPRRVATGQRTYINNIVVTGYQKRKSPSKHYVFVVDLVWDNDERYEIVRRYSEFFSLQESLKSVFPDAVRGGKNADDRTTLPELPGRIFLGRSHVAKVAEARLESINQYCQALIRMEHKISHCSYVVQFFSPQPGDKMLPKLRLHRPASLHPMKRPAGNLFEEHCVIAPFEAEGPGQISVQSGDQVLVLAKDSSGWWMIEFKKQVGWVPSSYLKKCPKMNEEEDVLGLVGSYSESKPAADNTDSGVETDSATNSISSRSSTPPGVEIDAEEYLAIDSYVACGPGQIGFDEGEVITVLDKMEDGWWFVTKGEEEGWCPCGYLEPLNKASSDDETVPTSSLDVEKYLTIADYVAEEDDEISFPAGVVAEVLQKSLTGWWMVRCQDSIGCAPATYLRKIREESEEEKPVETSPFSGGGLNSSFRQVPRQKTVRHKRSLKHNKQSVNPIIVGGEDENSQRAQKQNDSSSPRPRPRAKRSSTSIGETDERPRKDSSPKPPVMPRGNGWPDSSQPAGSPKPAVKAKPGQPGTSLLGLQTPPRPRQSQIVRARDYSPQRQDSQSLMADALHDRSPSPVEQARRLSQPRPNRRRDGSPRSSPGTQRKSSSSESDVKSPPTHVSQFPVHAAMAMVMAGGMSANNPFSQQLADSIVQYIIASDNPELVEALRKAVDASPEAKKVLGRQ